MIQKKIYNLFPSDILQNIYEYDPTFKNIYDIVIKLINGFGIMKRFRNNCNSPCLSKKDIIGKYVFSFESA